MAWKSANAIEISIIQFTIFDALSEAESLTNSSGRIFEELLKVTISEIEDEEDLVSSEYTFHEMGPNADDGTFARA